MIDINRVPDFFEVRVEKGEENDAELRFVRTKLGLEAYIRAEKSHPTLVRLRWHVPLHRPVSVLGDTWERGYGRLGFAGLSAERPLPWYFILAYKGGCDGVGVAVRPNAFVSWTADSEGVTAFCDLRAGTVGVALSGRELLIATFMSREYPAGTGEDNSFDAASAFCGEMCPDPLLPSEPVYGGNNWYYAYGKSSYEEILSDASLQAKLAEGLTNRPFMVIDDGWQPNPCAGPWVAGERFRDMKKLAEELLAMGVRPGLWIRPLCDDSDSIPAKWRFENRNNRLDPSVPEVLAHIREVVHKIVFDWGYQLIKHDFSAFDIFGDWGGNRGRYFTDGNWQFHDRSRTGAEIYKELCKTILEAAGERAYILGCNCISHLTAGYCHINRTGDDTSGTDWERTRRMGVNTLAFRMPQHGRFYHCDADCAGFLKGKIPFSLNKQWLTLLAKSGTPLFISAPEGAFSEEEFLYVKKLYTLASEQKNKAIPLDWRYNSSPALWSIDGKEERFFWFDKSGPAF